MSADFGRYVSLEFTGHDWLGVSYRAFDSSAQRPVALRLLRRAAGDARDGAILVTLLRRSLGCGAERVHSNVADVYEVGEVPVAAGVVASVADARAPDVYIAGEWIAGERLAALLAGNAAIDRARMHLWMSQILRGLGAAHRRGLVHGDLNPSNIMVVAGDEIRLLDLGLYSHDTFPAADESASAGWPLFISPEQNLGEAPGACTDIRAAGILLYRMLAGRMPFEGPPAVVARQVLTEDLPPLSALHPGLSAFDDVIGRATARSAQQRFASTDEFLLALNRVEFDASSASSGPTPAPAPTTTSTLARSPAPPAPQAATAAWKRAAQPALVAALAEVAGPMAPLLVEDAMRDAVTLEQCHEILAARITDPAARARLTALTRPRAAAIPADQRGGWPLPAAATLELRNVLGGEIGPMAALLVDRAAARAQSRVEFVELLTVMLPAGVPSERWLPTLRL